MRAERDIWRLFDVLVYFVPGDLEMDDFFDVTDVLNLSFHEFSSMKRN